MCRLYLCSVVILSCLATSTASADWDGDGIPDLVAICKASNEGKTEIHVLSGASNYQTYLTQNATALHRTDENWEFRLADFDNDSKPDLVAISKAANSGKTEIHVLSGASNFQTFILQTATALHRTDENWEFHIANYDGDSIPDLVAICKASNEGKTEIHVLSGSSNYQTYLTQNVTALHRTDENWEFHIANYDGDSIPDLVAICKASNEGKTEIHVLSGSSNYQTYLTQNVTALHRTDENWEFHIANYDGDSIPDLAAICKASNEGKTEIHVLSGSSNYQTYLTQNVTALHRTDENWTFEVSNFPWGLIGVILRLPGDTRVEDKQGDDGPKGPKGDGLNRPDPKGDGPNCPDPKGDGPNCPDPKGDGPNCPDPKSDGPKRFKQ